MVESHVYAAGSPGETQENPLRRMLKTSDFDPAA
jgi:hypothetical protein